MCICRRHIAVAALLTLTMAASADPLTVKQIQSNTADGDASIYDYQVVDCIGGICVAKFPGYRPRLVILDPNETAAWGAIQVKDWIYPYDMFEEVQIGDRVSFTNMFVEEYRGTTFLQRQSTYSPGYVIESSGNPLPPPIIIPVSVIPAPLYDAGDDGWYVEDHVAEPYESMRLIIRDVTVTTIDLGKAVDNYNLQDALGHDCWAADYMNTDVGNSGYHAFVTIGQHFCAVAGVFEQYKYLTNGWDYYQLITLDTPSLAICGDGNADGVADLNDLPVCLDCMTGPQCDDIAGGCNPPAWTFDPPGLDVQACLTMDLDYDGDVDLRDFATFQLIAGL
ncbi:MAG: hypothetical protein JXO22_18290 [Phycisphaerae bacterium]|nr:hypothetical protein [Phycisphaerae bacterium]